MALPTEPGLSNTNESPGQKDEEKLREMGYITRAKTLHPPMLSARGLHRENPS
jgi:hypothetical protein